MPSITPDFLWMLSNFFLDEGMDRPLTLTLLFPNKNVRVRGRKCMSIEHYHEERSLRG